MEPKPETTRSEETLVPWWNDVEGVGEEQGEEDEGFESGEVVGDQEK